MSKLTKEEFQAYLKQIRELAEGPLEEIQKEVEVNQQIPAGVLRSGDREQFIPLFLTGRVRRMGLKRA